MTKMPEKLRIRGEFLGGLAVVTDIADNGTEYIRADVAQARIEALEKENRALRANVSKSVLRRLEGQGVLRGEEER